uniref:DDE-1 domain-containing protein n=1 Tax=Plectus sambesii TaxID=2011161 RepID=A0A914X0R6_9BILA
MAGEKLPLLVIGKSANPRCFKHVRCLPVAYEANSKAWMNGSLFEQYVRKLNMRMRAKKRSIALIVDNCPAHSKLMGFSNVQLFFLPPNTTAKTKPRDADVIRNFKLRYRPQFCKERLATLNSPASFQFTVLDALRVAKFAWDCVKVNTIVNCFTHCGFSLDGAGLTEPVEDTSEELVAFESILTSTYQYLNEDTFSAASYLAVDNDIVTAAHLSLSEISHNAIGSSDSGLNMSDVEEVPDDAPVVPPLKDSYSLLSQLRLMVGAYAKNEAQASDMNAHLIQLSNASTDLSQSAARQTSITDFFASNAK